MLEAEIKRIKDAARRRPAPAAARRRRRPRRRPEVQQLGDVKVARPRRRSRASRRTRRSTSTTRRRARSAETPWSGSLDGEHKIIIEKRGYKVAESDDRRRIRASCSCSARCSARRTILGWVEVTSNVPGADIYIDDKSVGAVAKTPHVAEHQARQAHVLGHAPRATTSTKIEVEVVPGEHARGEGARSRARRSASSTSIGLGIEDSTIYIDGKVACERGPCLKALPAGRPHRRASSDPGYKSYRAASTIQAKTETTIKVALAPKPSRGDAVVAYILAARLRRRRRLPRPRRRTSTATSCARRSTPATRRVDSRRPAVPRRARCSRSPPTRRFVIAGISALTAIYYTFRDKGPPSTGLIDVRALALQPQIGPGYAGLGMEVQLVMRTLIVRPRVLARSARASGPTSTTSRTTPGSPRPASRPTTRRTGASRSRGSRGRRTAARSSSSARASRSTSTS